MNTKIHLTDFTGEGIFGPLTSLSKASELRCGAFGLEEKLIRRLELNGAGTIIVDPPSILADRVADPSGSVLSNADICLSSRCLLSDEAVRAILGSTSDECYLTPDGKLVGYRISEGTDIPMNLRVNRAKIDKLPKVTIDARRVDFPWQLTRLNGAEIAGDLELTESVQRGSQPSIPKDVLIRGAEHILATGEVYLGAGVVIDAEKHHVRLERNCRVGCGAILTAKDGPIWLAEDAEIEAGAILQGPVYIGSGSIVRAGARINGSVSLGTECRVGGEVSNVIMQGYSNKQHSGYLGGTVIGQWVNLGAATDNSDLKNNYRSIDVTLNGNRIDSGELHVGTFIGDFVRTAIQTRLNSGTAVGTCCNLFGNDFPEKAIPAFVWYGTDGYQEYRLDKALETIRVIMSRRKKELNKVLEEALNKLFDTSRDSRREFLKQNQRASK